MQRSSLSRLAAPALVAALLFVHPLTIEAKGPAPALQSADSPARPGTQLSGRLRAQRALLYGVESCRVAGVTFVGRRLYRPVLEHGRQLLEWVGSMFRKYVSASAPDAHSARWKNAEAWHDHGEPHMGFGHEVYAGSPLITSPLIPPTGATIKELGEQVRVVGRDDYVRKVEFGAAVNTSGMSYPQLSARALVALLYAHVKLAKAGVRQTYSTGEGGPHMHLAVLSGDGEALKAFVLAHGAQLGDIRPGSYAEAKVRVFIDRLMKERQKLFADLSPEDVKKAQIVMQFGSALNGVRGADGRIDWTRLKDLGASPYVAMVQYKLKQAAKRGARVDASKLSPIAAAVRNLSRKKDAASPPTTDEFSSFESIARLVKRTRQEVRKPVSLKFGVGSVQDTYTFLKFLVENDALPDHLQLDGADRDFSPGSGNATPGDNTSLPINEATIVVDAILKKLGVRDRVFVESTGGALAPADVVEKLALGADGVGAARLMLGVGVGCRMARHCDGAGKLGCPWGIASKDDALATYALDPVKVGQRGALGALAFNRKVALNLAETGTRDWRLFRQSHGLHVADNQLLKYDEGLRPQKLRDYYRHVAGLVPADVASPDELARLVFGGAMPAPAAR
ncbi:MAG: hypothetical protein IT371_10800 [Deltaproteobacteria bacterium]|nr:hypothetical protein [Deltaproteobacteria bacterium]